MHMESTTFAGLPLHVHRIRATQVCLEHAPWAEVGGGIIFVAFWEFTGAWNIEGSSSRHVNVMLYVPALVRLPVSMVITHVWYIGLIGHSREIASKIYGDLGICGRAVAFEVFNVGCWLTHGDLALEARVDFLVDAQHSLIPAGVHGEWARLKVKGLASFWAGFLSCW